MAIVDKAILMDHPIGSLTVRSTPSVKQKPLHHTDQLIVSSSSLDFLVFSFFDPVAIVCFSLAVFFQSSEEEPFLALCRHQPRIRWKTKLFRTALVTTSKPKSQRNRGGTTVEEPGKAEGSCL